ncbi:hypothetical protein L6452_15131 [Arctium lappa]|uniref:Uncharacterized protein n=1 Tax=Arctium lappa TaxID=4217 RepID=A0ACB9CMW6_ARCLA|nr:hypothetical protein L6452_15131 [Arctium lappa]
MENLAKSSSTLVLKVPMLRPNEFDMWKIRIKQYILLTDYSMWDIIENGPSEEGKIGADGKRTPPKTDADRKIRQTEMKALSTLLLAIPNEYQHQFCNCTDVEMLWNALEKRFSGTKSTKRNQKAILKQQYENFMSTKNESMTQTFDRFNKLIGELATVGVQIDQDDLNRKFLRSLSDEWTMYTVSFRQNDQLEEKELDDLYNDLRVFESEVEAKKRPSGYVHNAALLSASTDSTSNPESSWKLFSQNVDLEQLHLDDLEEMDIKWQMAMLSMRVKKFIKRTGRNNFSQRREDGAGFDKSKVECYKCHQKGHFARECRSGMSQNNNHQQAQSGSFNNNRNSAQALVSQQGMGFDWSDQAEEAIHNQALMAEVSDLPTENMSDDLERLEKDIKDYVRIVERFEEQIKGFQANELQHSYDTNYWKWEKKDLELQLTRSKEESEKLRGELAKVKLDVEKFSNASKSMDSLLQTQIHDKLRRGIGYNNTPPPYNNNYIPPSSDLLETKDKKDLPKGATEIDPLDKVLVKHTTEKEVVKDKNNTVSGEIPIESHIITNEGCGKHWIKSKDIEKTEGKNKKVYYKQTTVVNPIPRKQCAYNVKMWIPKLSKTVSTAITNSAANSDSTARSNTAASNVSTADIVSTSINVNTANSVSAANKVNTAKPVSTANSVSTSKDSVASSISATKPIILTKYSNTKCSDFKSLGNQQLKGKSIWHVDSRCSRHMTGNMSCLQDFKHINGGHVAFGDNLIGGKISGKGNVTKVKMTFEDVYYVDQLKYNLLSVSQLLHMDLFGPTNVMSIGKKSYCLVIVDDYSRFTWVYFLRTKDETKKGIEKQYSAPRTPQQNGVAERRNRTLIEAARSLLADSKLSITFWAEAANTACYVQNRVLVVKQKNKTPYELLNKRKPFIGFFKPFGCPCTILNTKTHLGEFDSKADDGFLVGYSSQSKAYRVFNSSSRIIEESDNVKCNENTPNPIRTGPQWLFDIDSLTNSFGFSSDDYAGSGCGGSGNTQVQESISKSVIFPIPTVTSFEDCEKEPSTGPSQSEEKGRDEETLENKESEVAAENTSVG